MNQPDQEAQPGRKQKREKRRSRRGGKSERVRWLRGSVGRVSCGGLVAHLESQVWRKLTGERGGKKWAKRRVAAGLSACLSLSLSLSVFFAFCLLILPFLLSFELFITPLLGETRSQREESEVKWKPRQTTDSGAKYNQFPFNVDPITRHTD